MHLRTHKRKDPSGGAEVSPGSGPYGGRVVQLPKSQLQYQGEQARAGDPEVKKLCGVDVHVPNNKTLATWFQHLHDEPNNGTKTTAATLKRETAARR
jgi:hypothetical protein